MAESCAQNTNQYRHLKYRADNRYKSSLQDDPRTILQESLLKVAAATSAAHIGLTAATQTGHAEPRLKSGSHQMLLLHFGPVQSIALLLNNF